MHIPEACAQTDGPGEATRQSAWPDSTELPQKRGKSRNSAAVWMTLTTRFRLQLHPGLYLLLHYKYPCRRSRKGIERRIRVFFQLFSLNFCTIVFSIHERCGEGEDFVTGDSSEIKVTLLFSFNFCNFILFCDLSDCCFNL